MKALLKFNSVVAVLIILVVSLASSCEPGKEDTKNLALGEALGTTYSIIYLTVDSLDLQENIDSVFRVVNRSMSTYIPESDISRINRGDTSVTVDAMFREVLDLSREVYGKTDGYFDPTVGILVNAWGFGPSEGGITDSLQIAELMTYVGLDKITLTPDNRIRKAYPEMQIDFNAIAKGYAIDRLAVMLDSHGIENYLVEVGGEIVARGTNTLKGQPWVVGIDDPQVEVGRRLKLTLFLENEALASSGNYRKFRIDPGTGEKYVHTIDPKTGFTKSSNVLSASVIGPSCAIADAFATAFMAMDLESSIQYLEKDKTLEAYIIYLNEEGEVSEFFTPGFRAKVRE
ncbi:thiamine biosynthesis lipoprotein [Muriicola jejuensis]|uniref:FAD:protein FMN transferase n=1 Tax=Muriicola jejuensis TaxID=504488 RepID=A0A6P0UGP5_9FLAO|nr:FAD:protein FMN transferase [Muriicola jejuensis]NER09296.1 FAD:protein FMN transferase [Muriicola jejuensis]SMP09688.1 thiamine biosynthesis lipoprotein [Muriicola jejuensis]